VAELNEPCNEPSGSIKCGEYFDRGTSACREAFQSMRVRTQNFSLGEGGRTDLGAMCKLCFILKITKLCYKNHVTVYTCNITLAATALVYINTAASSVTHSPKLNYLNI